MQNRIWLLTLIFTISCFAPIFAGETTKNARKGDIAKKYVLKDNGNFFRILHTNRKCQITSNVKSFKVSSHPADAAMVYFVRRGDLYILKNTKTNGQCPPADKKVITKKLMMDGKKKYKYNVVPSIHSTIVNMSLDQKGVFRAWGNKKKLIELGNIKNYSMNQNFGRKGKPFQKSLVFLMGKNGKVYKVNGKNPSSSKWTKRTFSSLKDFKRKNNLK